MEGAFCFPPSISLKLRQRFGRERERERTGLAGINVAPLKHECTNSVLRVMGDSLSSKFDFRLIMGEIVTRRRGGGRQVRAEKGTRVFSRGSITEEQPNAVAAKRVVAEI